MPSKPAIQNQPSPIPDPSVRFQEIWHQLTDVQRRFLIARTQHPSKHQAALSIGLQPDTVYHWGPLINEALALIQAQILQTAVIQLSQVVARAALIKTQGLDLADPRLQQQVATEILDRVLGKPRTAAPNPADEPTEIIVRYIDQS